MVAFVFTKIFFFFSSLACRSTRINDAMWLTWLLLSTNRYRSLDGTVSGSSLALVLGNSSVAINERSTASFALFYRILSHLRTGPAKVPLTTTVMTTMMDVVVNISDRAWVETLRTARAKAKAPRKPEKMIIVCHRQLIGFLRMRLSTNERSTTHRTRATVMDI